MKYMTGFILLLLMQNVFAAHCQVDGGPWVDMKTSPLDVHVDLRLDKDAGKVTMSGYSVRCMHDFRAGILILTSNTFQPWPAA